MTLNVNNLVGFGAAPAGGVSTLTKKTHGYNTTDSITFPADIVAGDLLVVIGDAAGSSGSPTITTPSGWTLVGSAASGSPNNTTIAIWYKIANGSEASSTVSAWFSGDFFTALGYITFRPDKPITAVVAKSYQSQITDGNPTAQVIPSGSGTPVLVAIGNSIGALTLTPNDGVVNDSGSEYIGWKIYNASPANVTADAGDTGSGNTLQSCYFEVS